MNSFGRIFRISIYGESHGPQVAVTIDGVRPGILLSEEDFYSDLERRKPGAKGTTTRMEEDKPMFLSGLFEGKTTGAPLTIAFTNKEVRSADYKQQLSIPRPGHADFVAKKKFSGFQDYRGGGHFSGRLTAALVAAGVVAKKQLASYLPQIKIEAQLIEAGGIADIEKAINEAINSGDSIGGVVECNVHHLPIGLGEPFFDSVESVVSHAIFSIPAIKGIEFGSGFSAALMKGSEHNDVMTDENGTLLTNHSGGVSGGITNGNPLIFRVAVKPTSSTPKQQQSYNMETGKMENFRIQGRHDLCIALRMPVVVEAVTAFSLLDLMHIHQAIQPTSI